MRTLFFASVLSVLYVVYDGYAGFIDGYVSPVVRDFRITRVEDAGGGKSRMWGDMNIVRAGCSPQGIDWGRAGPGRVGFGVLEIEEEAKSRSLGYNEWGPWVVNIPPDVVESQSRVVVYH